MKSKILYPILALAFLMAAPQVMGQSKRAERKLKREMRKLEKQMKKVSELKQESGVFFYNRDEIFSPKQLKELEHAKLIQKEMAYKQRDMAKKYRQIATKESKKHREMALKQAKEAREIARVYQKENLAKIKEHQHKAMKEAKKAFEEQKIHFQELREQYPDGIEFPDVNFELPEFEFEYDIPELDIDIPEFPKVYQFQSNWDDADNNMTIQTELDNESVSKDYSYTVDNDAATLNLRVKGSVEAGEVTITVKSPDGKEYQSIELSPAADVNWNQKMKLEGEEKDKFKGKWTINAKGENVQGHYSIYMRSK